MGKRVIVMDQVETGSLTTALRICAVRRFAGGLLLVAMIPLGGCRICANCEDSDYAAYGGVWQRTTRESGRVGSLFDPAGGLTTDLVSRDDPESPDALERARREASGTEVTDQDRASEDESDKQREDDINDSMEDELRQFDLKDIEEEEKENELRNKQLDDINVHVIPGQPMPPRLR